MKNTKTVLIRITGVIDYMTSISPVSYSDAVPRTRFEKILPVILAIVFFGIFFSFGD